ncbi:MAG: Bax inhibitor-1/YccA family protein [bacterium]
MPNPVLAKFDTAATRSPEQQYPYAQGQPRSAPAPSPEQLQNWYNQPSYTQPGYAPPTPPTGPARGGWGGGGGSGAPSRYMTLDDVVVRTGAMLAVIFAAGALTWSLGPTGRGAGGLIGIGLIGGLALGLYMAFTMKANAVTALVYAAFEGLLLGGVSRAFEDAYPGIVIQALTGTLFVAGGMLFAYKIGAIKVTPRFTKMVVAATIGVVGLMIVNLVAGFFVDGGLGLRDGGGLAIAFSLLCIALAAFNLAIDFEMIQQGIRHGVDQKFAWYASFGLIVTLVWLYFEILRMLGYLRD